MSGKKGKSGHRPGQKNRPRVIVRPVRTPPQQKMPPQVTPYPTAGAKVTEFERKLDDQLGAAETAKRPAQPAKEQAAGPQNFGLEIIKPVIAMPFDLWAARVDLKELKLSKDELNLLAGPVKELLDYYLPQIPVIAYAWISVSVAAYSVMKVRLELIAELKKQKPAVTVDGTSQGQGGPIPPMSNGVFPTMAQIKKPVT